MHDRPALAVRAPSHDGRACASRSRPRRHGRAVRAARGATLALALGACQNDPVGPRAPAARPAAALLGDAAGSSARVRCGQPTHAWVRIVAPPYNEIDYGATVWFAGVVVPRTSAAFGVYDASGALRMSHYTRASGGNCVIAHEPEARTTYELEPGVYSVYASYYGLNSYTGATEYVPHRLVQTIRVREPAPVDPDPCPQPPPEWPPEIPWPGGCFGAAARTAR